MALIVLVIVLTGDSIPSQSTQTTTLGKQSMYVSPSRPLRLVLATGQVFLGVLILGAVERLAAATYHLDCQSGRDQNDGLSPATAWQTLTRANQQTYGPGDSLLLKRGCLWQGPGFKARGNGNALAPITLADYGPTSLPLPNIDGVGPHEPAVLLQNVQHWTVRNRDLTQHGQTRSEERRVGKECRL